MLLTRIMNLIHQMADIFQSGNPAKILGAILGLVLAAVTSFWL